MRESEFYEMTLAEFLRWAKAYDERNQRDWHKWRTLICFSFNPHVTSEYRVKPSELVQLPLYDDVDELIISEEQIKLMEERWPKQ